MAKLSPTQLISVAKAGGFNVLEIPTAVAVALAESGGDPSALGDVDKEDSTWGPSVGLWQIRSLKSAKGTGGVRDETANMNAVTNAVHAHQLYVTAGWKQWSTFTSGGYNKYLGTGGVGLAPTDALGNAVTDAAKDAAGALTPDWASSVVKAAAQLGAAGKWLGNRDNWIRILKVGAGVVMVGVGVAMVVEKPAMKAAEVAGQVAKVAAV